MKESEEGSKEGRKEGRKEESKEVSKEGINVVRKGGQKEGTK